MVLDMLLRWDVGKIKLPFEREVYQDLCLYWNMEKLQLLIHVFLILLKFKGLITQNLTFYNDEKSWIDAANFCSIHGGVLESNVTLLLQHFSGITQSGEHEDIWLGKIELLTKWTYVRGCFYIYGDFKHFVIETSEQECQMLCNGYKFYSIKGKDCYCIEDIQSFHRSANCNCVGCYKVWEHQFSSFDNDNAKEHCIAVKCERRHLKRSSEMCEEHRYSVTCDNGVELKDNYTDYQAAADECARQDSFIKWYPENYCDTYDHDELQQKYWTSGTRHIETFRLRKSYITLDLTLEGCYILEYDDDYDDYKEEITSCVETSPFYCTFGGNEDKGDIVSLPTVMIPQQKSVKSDKIGNIAAGTVTSIVAVIAVILAIFFIHRRRLSNKKTTCHELNPSENERDAVDRHIYNKTPQPVIYHEIEVKNLSPHNGKFKYPQTVNNITYDYAQSNCTPKWQNVNQVAINTIQSIIQSNHLNDKAGQNGYEMAKVQSVTRDCSEGVMTKHHCLAKPISSKTEEESDQYAINRDYDHLDNVKQKEDPVTKVYDHLPTIVTEDPTYDHSNLKIVLDKEDYYDHFKIDGAHS
ncbi:uncharacterized protein LOC143055523 [Mytilus galloprovincialis]|uniref:uncharacterized protein LOC143055523 n=1 Tax=Mytilus galloprovincialis TaxID=29158 RepID=UPI003F7CB214